MQNDTSNQYDIDTNNKPTSAFITSLYTSQEFSSPIIFYFNEGYQGEAYLWDKNGTFAWKNSNCKKYFMHKVEPTKLQNAIENIKENYELGARCLGGQRYPFVLNTLGNSLNTHLQITADSYYQCDTWTTDIIKYFEEHGVDSIDMSVSNYQDVFPFNTENTFSSVLFRYLRQNQKPEDCINTEDTSYILRQFKEDITHLLFCKNIARLFRNQNDTIGEGSFVINIRSENVKVQRFGKKISEYQYKYKGTAVLVQQLF